QADLVRRGEITPSALVDAAIARIERVNPKLNAVIIPLFEKARAQAAAPDLPRGPFRGVPFLLKDLLAYSAGDPHHMGTRRLKQAGFVAPHDSNTAARLRAAGFVFLGKTNTPEIGTLPTTEPDAYGPTRNPWDPSRSTGGSSAAAAAAVRAGGGHGSGKAAYRHPRATPRRDGADTSRLSRRGRERGAPPRVARPYRRAVASGGARRARGGPPLLDDVRHAHRPH